MVEELQIDTTDYRGRRIICAKNYWEAHIVECPHHAYMEDEVDSVIDALKNPYLRMRFIDDEYINRRCYYKLSYSRDYYTKVIVEFLNDQGEGEGRIITAYMPDSMKPTEKPEL